MTENNRPPGVTTIAPDVLTQIARLTVLSVDDVVQLAPIPTSVDRLFLKNANEGVLVELEDNVVNAEIHVILRKNVNIRTVSREIQAQVARAISEMVGLEIGKIDIHVEDISYQDFNAKA